MVLYRNLMSHLKCGVLLYYIHIIQMEQRIKNTDSAFLSRIHLEWAPDWAEHQFWASSKIWQCKAAVLLLRCVYELELSSTTTTRLLSAWKAVDACWHGMDPTSKQLTKVLANGGCRCHMSEAWAWILSLVTASGVNNFDSPESLLLSTKLGGISHLWRFRLLSFHNYSKK
jgi:hypothetical protein